MCNFLKGCHIENKTLWWLQELSKIVFSASGPYLEKLFILVVTHLSLNFESISPWNWKELLSEEIKCVCVFLPCSG